MAPPSARHINSSLDLTGAIIRETQERDEDGVMHPAPSIELPNQDAQYVSHIALDIGGSLIKLVYFSPDNCSSDEEGPETDLLSRTSLDAAAAEATGTTSRSVPPSPLHRPNNHNGRGGRLHFVKFETANVEECIAFIEAKGLHRIGSSSAGMRVKATGGGAFRYADLFKERLGVVLEKEDEMGCLVAGCNFLLKAITHEAFTFENNTAQFVPTNSEADLYPYLLVNIGSGVSMLKVTGEGQFERVSGSTLGGGTFWGLCRLLTGMKDFDEMLELSVQGDNSSVDMLVGDIYGGRDYTSIGLSATTIASSFGKVISQDKSLDEYKSADISMALCRMVSYNIGQLAYLNAIRYGIKRILFGGFFIRGHPYTMETISFAIKFWSKGEMAAMFLRHEGFLGAVGAFLLVHPAMTCIEPRALRAACVERFRMGAPLTGGQVVGPAIEDLQGKINWVEKFVSAGPAHTAPSSNRSGTLSAVSSPMAPKDGTHSNFFSPSVRRAASAAVPDTPLSPELQAQQVTRAFTYTDQPLQPAAAHMSLHCGVLHIAPRYAVFPLLDDPESYEPNIICPTNEEEMRWWMQLLADQIPNTVNKASSSEGDSEESQRRAAAFGRALGAHMEKLQAEPGAYGALGLAELFELREECLREFGFHDVYKLDKVRENSASLLVLPDLLADVDAHPAGKQRWLALIEGALAANIFDWGANACVALYESGTILDIYREARSRLSKRPWALDNFDDLMQRIVGRDHQRPYARVMMFVDNAGADIVLGQLPIAREFLRLGCEVVMVANHRPAINDITAGELHQVLAVAAQHCPIIRDARAAALKLQEETGGRVPSITRQRSLLAQHATLTSASQQPSSTQQAPSAAAEQQPSTAQQASSATPQQQSPLEQPATFPAAGDRGAGASHQSIGMGGYQPSGAKLFVVDNGQGSPCLNLRRIPDVLAEAAVGTGLIILEGMGRAIHTNFNTNFKCDALLLAMVKTERLAKHLFGAQGSLYDCVCKVGVMLFYIWFIHHRNGQGTHTPRKGRTMAI